MKRALLISLCMLCLLSCARAQPSNRPEKSGDDWQVTTPDQVGLDADKLDQAVARIADGTYQNVHAIVVARRGKLVFERYFRGHTFFYDGDQYQGDRIDFDRDTTHNLASVTKSVTSILMGIAIEQGAIQSVDAEVFDFFPQYAHLNDPHKETITLKHLLTMSAGLQWNGMEVPLSNPGNDLIRLFRVSDPIEYILAKPLVSVPGEEFYYNGGCTNLLGEVIRTTTGQRLDAFSSHLFEPLGITDYEWDFINADIIHASGNLKLRPRDMAKIGQLALNGGEWDGRSIVSEAWIAESTRHHIASSSTSGYGYQWWLKTYQVGDTAFDAFYAAGWGGQKILVFPDWDMVVVFTGGNYASRDPSEEILTRYILPAVQEND